MMFIIIKLVVSSNQKQRNLEGYIMHEMTIIEQLWTLAIGSFIVSFCFSKLGKITGSEKRC